MTEETVEVLWNQVREGWGEDKRHQAFLGYCREHGLLGEAAQRYRSVSNEAETGPYRSTEGQREDAKKRLAAIQLLALATIEAEPRTDATSVKRWLRVGAVVTLFLTLGFIGWVLARLQNFRPD